MLTIQPKFTAGNAFRPSFRAEDADFLTEDNYNEERDFFEKQIDGFDDIINDEYMPEKMKKGVKFLRIISEGILEGWAVAWGAKKGINFLRKTGTKTLNSKTYTKAKEILTPAKEGLAKARQNIKKYIGEKLQKIGETQFGQKVKNSKFGKFIKNAFENISAKISAAKTKIQEKTNKITFEQATNATATTLGVGSGTAGAINSAIEANEKEYYEVA